MSAASVAARDQGGAAMNDLVTWLIGAERDPNRSAEYAERSASLILSLTPEQARAAIVAATQMLANAFELHERSKS